MLAEPDRAHAASALADAAAYSKASVAQALDVLTMAGILNVQPSANRLVYRLAHPTELAGALQWLPAVFPDWWPIFKVTAAIAEFAQASIAPSARTAAVGKVLQLIDPELKRLGVVEEVPRSSGPASYNEFEHWAITFLADQCGRGEMVPAAREVTYTIHHLSFGGWLGTVSQRGRRPRHLDVTREGQPDATSSPSAELDERTGATQLAGAMFADALSRARSTSTDLPVTEDLTRRISGEFAGELLQSMRPGQEATFTAEFIRRWFENRRQRFRASA
jgi:hypothetical protein